MAIKTVTNDNLSEFVAERTARGSQISTGEELVAAATKVATGTGTGPTPGNPIITSGVETSSDAPLDPGNKQPTAAEQAKAGTDPGVQKRIDRAVAAQREAEELFEDEYNARLLAENQVVELQKQIKAAQPEPPKPVELKRPSPKDFTTQEEYDAAMETYDKARDERVRQEAREEGRQQARQAAQNQAMQAKVEQARKDLPDFTEVIEAASKRTTVVPDHIKAAFFELDYGPQVAYELAKDPLLEKRIFALSPAKALSELGKLELKYANKPTLVTEPNTAPKESAKPPPETTRAPAPLQSVRATGEGQITVDLSQERDFAKYKQARLDQIRARRRH